MGSVGINLPLVPPVFLLNSTWEQIPAFTSSHRGILWPNLPSFTFLALKELQLALKVRLQLVFWGY